MSQPMVCNSPIVPLTTQRSARLWQTMLQPGLPGTLLLSKIQLNHGVVDDSPLKFEDRILALYTAVVKKFATLHGETSRCFLMRAPESVELVGVHTEAFGGSALGLACFETVLCVGVRSDKNVTIAHVDEKFAATEFDWSAASPKTRVIDWTAHANSQKSAEHWSDAIKNAVLYYVNRHKGPTGQVELNIPGLNIVVGSVLPPGYATHSDTTLTVASLAAVMAASGEWGKLPLAEFAGWCDEAQQCGSGRRNSLGPILFGMPTDLVHSSEVSLHPKSKHVPAGHVVLLAHTGLPDTSVAGSPSFRAATTQIGMALLQKAAASRAASAARGRDVLMSDDQVLEMLTTIPQNTTRAAVLEAGIAAPFIADLKTRFAAHPNPASGYPVREKLLYVLAEMARSARAASALRSGDMAAIAAYMNIGQVGEASLYHRLTASGRVDETFPIIQASSDEELTSMSEQGDPLWRQSGRSGASTPETDLLCDLALNIPGVLAARWSGSQRVAIVCKHEVVKLLIDGLNLAYYSPRSLAVGALATQVFPCRGVSIVED